MITERLITYEMSQEPSQWTKTIVVVVVFGRFLLSDGSVMANSGTIRQHSVFSKALIYFIIASIE